MQSEKTTGSGLSVFSRIESAGEYLFTVFMVMLAAIGGALSRFLTAVGRKLAWAGGKLLILLKRLGGRIAEPFKRYIKVFRIGNGEVRRAREKGVLPACAAGTRMTGRILFGKRGLIVTLCNWALPVISCVFLFSVVSYANSMTYALRLSVNGDFMGYVTDESVFNDAEKIVQQRITYLDSNTEMFTFDSSYEVEMVGYGSTLTKYQLADKMLSSVDAEISFAYGMYIGNSFYGALESKDRVEQTLESLLDVYREGGEETVAFESKITYEPGLYLTESIVSEDSIIKLITTKKTVAAYYTVVEGDSPLGVLSKLDMTEDELAKLNPDFSLESFMQIGDKLLITQEEPFLAVTVTRRETYEEKTDYETEYVDDPTHYQGSSTITRDGEKGVERVTADVSYVNGVETKRKVLNRVTVSEPVSEIIALGTKEIPSGVTAQIPQNRPVGQFIWPVGGSDGGQISEMMYGYGGYYNHGGIDIVAPYGTPIFAAESGTVILAQWYYGYGNCVMIQHDSGIVTVYGHASYLHVYQGQRVTAGELIADVGSTGQSTANHCHFEVRINGVQMNPINYLPWHKRAAWCVEY
ncbi:MAG: peptidoglycan DD-metalloendopeptidase family protein [Oscillospiraceae bacterium]|nr:peptidoglycan DD-metalloendopeptidase family protein [Oscillospiraceae bacterium]